MFKVLLINSSEVFHPGCLFPKFRIWSFTLSAEVSNSSIPEGCISLAIKNASFPFVVKLTVGGFVAYTRPKESLLIGLLQGSV